MSPLGRFFLPLFRFYTLRTEELDLMRTQYTFCKWPFRRRLLFRLCVTDWRSYLHIWMPYMKLSTYMASHICRWPICRWLILASLSLLSVTKWRSYLRIIHAVSHPQIKLSPSIYDAQICRRLIYIQMTCCVYIEDLLCTSRCLVAYM